MNIIAVTSCQPDVAQTYRSAKSIEKEFKAARFTVQVKYKDLAVLKTLY